MPPASFGHPYESPAEARVAWAQTWLGRAAEALIHAHLAVDLARRHADDWALATALSTLARSMIADGRIEGGLAALEGCIDLDVRNGSPQWVIGLRMRHQAEAYRELRRFDRARATAWTAVLLIAGDPRSRRTEQARTRTVLAEILLDLDLIRPAHDELLSAADLLDPEVDHVYRGRGARTAAAHWHAVGPRRCRTAPGPRHRRLRAGRPPPARRRPLRASPNREDAPRP